MCVTTLHCRPKPKICRLKPATCRPAQVRSRQGPVTYCHPEPPCVVTDITNGACVSLEIISWTLQEAIASRR